MALRGRWRNSRIFLLKQVNGTTIYLRDVASVSDGFQVQTNVVRQDGHRGVLLSVLKNGNASTLDVVKGIRTLLPRVASTVPPELKMTPLSDQSFSCVELLKESFAGDHCRGPHGDHDSCLPRKLAIYPDYCSLYSAFNSYFGDCAQSDGRDDQYDDFGVDWRWRSVFSWMTQPLRSRISSAFWKRAFPLREAILEGAAQISVPALVSTLCICIVFLPMFFLGGVARYLFVPLAEAVGFCHARQLCSGVVLWSQP